MEVITENSKDVGGISHSKKISHVDEKLHSEKCFHLKDSFTLYDWKLKNFIDQQQPESF